MYNRTVRMVIFIIAAIILAGAVMSFVKDINYFLNKEEGTAKILSVTDLGVQQPYRITLRYYNKKVRKEITSNIKLKKSYGNELKANKSPSIKVYYAANSPQNVYLADYQSPRVGIIIFDLILIVLMSIAVIANKDVFKKNKLS